jgi:hypothetical protein
LGYDCVSRKLDNGRILDSEPKADSDSRLNINNHERNSAPEITFRFSQLK